MGVADGIIVGVAGYVKSEFVSGSRIEQQKPFMLNVR